MSRGRLESPNLDDRTWQEIVDQARALIPRYAPEWTDHNPSDPGMALVELFAWMVEGLIYRLNRVPEKNLIEFLNLIGVTRHPARPASTYLVYRIDSSRPQVVIPQGSQAATRQTENEDAIVFETDEPLRALPLNLVQALLIAQGGQPQYTDVSDRIIRPPLSGLAIAPPANGSVMLALGFDAASAEPLALRVRLLQPAADPPMQLTWLYSQGINQPAAWAELAREQVEDPSGGLRQHTVVTARVPVEWAAEKPTDWNVPPAPGAVPADKPLFWLAVRFSAGAQPAALSLESALFNSVHATNALTIREPELLGASSGQPFQTFELRQRPLFMDPAALDPLGHVRIQVRQPQSGGFGPWADWRRVDEFPPGGAAVYRLNPVTGEVDFGSYHPVTAPQGQGLIPPAGSEVRAAGYRHVAGGARGNVAPGAVGELRTPQPGVSFVQNPGQGRGGMDEEPVEETKRRGPEALRARRRAVTLEDYEYLALEASPEVSKARALPPLVTGQATGELARPPGMVNVIIAPAAPPAAPRPLPTTALIQQVNAYLAERRDITADVHVTHPRYLPIDVQVDIRVFQSAVTAGLVPNDSDFAGYKALVRGQIDAFLHPLYGGVDGSGWEVGQDATISSLFDAIRPPSGIGFISNITIKAGPVSHTRPSFGGSTPTAWVQSADYELICSGSHTINVSTVPDG